MDDIGFFVEGVTSLDDLFDPTDLELERATDDIGDLLVGVAVQGADRPLLKVQLTEHQVIIVGEDLASHALACPLSLDGIAKDKICSLHLVVLLQV
jgi:hypothetical protein